MNYTITQLHISIQFLGFLGIHLSNANFRCYNKSDKRDGKKKPRKKEVDKVRMNIFERTMILVLCLFLFIVSLMTLVHVEMHSFINPIYMAANIILAMLIGIYNFLLIYKRATTLVIVGDENFLMEGCDNS